MSRRTVWLVVGAAVIAAVVYAASPVLAARQLVAAARAGDEAALERRVDFPAFRESLKAELNARLMAEMRAEEDGAGRALALLFGPALVSGMVDAFVTPQAIAAMVRDAEPPEPDPDAARPPAEPPARDDAEVRQAYGFRDLNTFTVTLTREGREDDPVVLLMKRRGVLDWKLSGVDLPDRPVE